MTKTRALIFARFVVCHHLCRLVVLAYYEPERSVPLVGELFDSVDDPRSPVGKLGVGHLSELVAGSAVRTSGQLDVEIVLQSLQLFEPYLVALVHVTCTCRALRCTDGR